jgi:hypothetical protein
MNAKIESIAKPEAKPTKAKAKAKTKVEVAADIEVAQLKAFRQQLGDLGYTSVFDVVRQGRAQAISNYFGKKTAKRAEKAKAERFYEQAEAQAAALTRLHRQLTARGEPVAQAIAKLGIAYDAEWLERAIGSSGNYHEWFGQDLLYSHPDSVGSLFSPGSYLTTLYRAAKPLHPATHGLQLDNRRPDLASLTLSDSHLNQELSTLALTLEVLEQGVGDDVEEKLRTAIYPMNLPYNHAWEQIRQGLAVRKTSQAEVWAVMGDYEALALSPLSPDAWVGRVMSPAEVRDRLGISPELYRILTQGQVPNAQVMQYYGRSSLISQWSLLLESTRMSNASLHDALGTGPYVKGPAVLLGPPPQDLQLRVNRPSGEHYVDFKIQRISYAIEEGQVRLLCTVQVQRTVGFIETLSVIAISSSPDDYSNYQVVAQGDNPPWEAPTSWREVNVQFDLGKKDEIQWDGLTLYFVAATSSAVGTAHTASAPFRVEFIRHDSAPTEPTEYGARYINAWPHATWPKPMYGYIGAHVGHPATEPSPVGALHNGAYQPLERLNRIIRLQKHLPINFEELDWIIAASAQDIAHYPLSWPLVALSVYLPLRKRYGLSVNAFVACIGPINTFHRPNEPSFFQEMFGDNDFIGTRLYLSPPRDDAPSAAARTRLCKGLGISADVFMTLARLLPGVLTDDGMGGNGYVLPSLDATHVDALYRLVMIPRLFGLDPVEVLGLWDLLGEPSSVARSLTGDRPMTMALGVLERTAYLVDWMRRENLDASSLIALTSRDYRQVATPELRSFIQNIYTTMGGTNAAERNEQALRELLCRHIGAQFSLKPATSLRLINWMDNVAARLDPAFAGYSVLKFWEQIQAACGSGATDLTALESEEPQLVQYANLLGQFSLLCHWAQLTEQDLELVMPGATPSPLTGKSQSPLPDLPFLLLLSRYRRWQKALVQPVAEGRRYLQRAAAGEMALVAKAAQELAVLHDWDVVQVEGCLNILGGTVPKSFADLYPLVTRMQLAQRLGQAPTDLAMLQILAGATPSQATLKQVAAAVLAAAHA